MDAPSRVWALNARVSGLCDAQRSPSDRLAISRRAIAPACPWTAGCHPILVIDGTETRMRASVDPVFPSNRLFVRE